jgi:hypothetical protein
MGGNGSLCMCLVQGLWAWQLGVSTRDRFVWLSNVVLDQPPNILCSTENLDQSSIFARKRPWPPAG